MRPFQDGTWGRLPRSGALVWMDDGLPQLVRMQGTAWAVVDRELSFLFGAVFRLEEPRQRDDGWTESRVAQVATRVELYAYRELLAGEYQARLAAADGASAQAIEEQLYGIDRQLARIYQDTTPTEAMVLAKRRGGR